VSVQPACQPLTARPLMIFAEVRGHHVRLQARLTGAPGESRRRCAWQSSRTGRSGDHARTESSGDGGEERKGSEQDGGAELDPERGCAGRRHQRRRASIW